MLSSTYTSNLVGLIPRTTRTLFLPILNSTCTSVPPLFTEFTNCPFDILRNGLLNNPKHNASNVNKVIDKYGKSTLEEFF